MNYQELQTLVEENIESFHKELEAGPKSFRPIWGYFLWYLGYDSGHAYEMVEDLIEEDEEGEGSGVPFSQKKGIPIGAG